MLNSFSLAAGRALKVLLRIANRSPGAPCQTRNTRAITKAVEEARGSGRPRNGLEAERHRPGAGGG
jgi:hypothetical protein